MCHVQNRFRLFVCSTFVSWEILKQVQDDDGKEAKHVASSQQLEAGSNLASDKKAEYIINFIFQIAKVYIMAGEMCVSFFRKGKDARAPCFRVHFFWRGDLPCALAERTKTWKQK
jgi:hypothetical protein